MISKRGGSAQVDTPAEQRLEVKLKLRQVDEATIRFEVDKQINIAEHVGIVTCDRSEQPDIAGPSAKGHLPYSGGQREDVAFPGDGSVPVFQASRARQQVGRFEVCPEDPPVGANAPGRDPALVDEPRHCGSRESIEPCELGGGVVLTHSDYHIRLKRSIRSIRRHVSCAQ